MRDMPQAELAGTSSAIGLFLLDVEIDLESDFVYFDCGGDIMTIATEINPLNKTFVTLGTNKIWLVGMAFLLELNN
jgi:hypothetical protein